MKKIVINENQKGLLFKNGRYSKMLDAGKYHILGGSRVDILNVKDAIVSERASLETLLKDEKIKEAVSVVEVKDEQLALREYVSKHKFDEILENKEHMTAVVFERLKSKEKELFVEFKDAGVKDIILPGEIRDIMNTVLIAEKKAQANVITRREEVASTRSLLNTAKLMDENKTLYKLKELEFLERICENVGNIEITGKGDVITQLAEILQSKGA